MTREMPSPARLPDPSVLAKLARAVELFYGLANVVLGTAAQRLKHATHRLLVALDGIYERGRDLVNRLVESHPRPDLACSVDANVAVDADKLPPHSCATLAILLVAFAPERRSRAHIGGSWCQLLGHTTYVRPLPTVHNLQEVKLFPVIV